MNLPVVLFIDEVCNKVYDPHILATESLGGSEGSVVRIAEGLAATGLFEVEVWQHCRHVPEFGKACYTYPAENSEIKPNYVISLRSPETLRRAKERFPRARHFLWNHDLCNAQIAQGMLAQSDFTAIAVSNFHKTQIQQALYPQGYDGQFPVKVIYNPIDETLAPDSTPVDPNKLIWTSSPHKGLDYALTIFSNLRRFNGDFKLYIANPGYLPNSSNLPDGCVGLGTLPHSDVIQHLRSSLCLFYPNCIFPETFGIALAEANMVATPVITHPIGAAREVLYHPSETLDCRNVRTVIDRVLAWHSGNRPKVKANPKFRLSNVIAAWRKLLNV